ncbi:hypothetical protein BKA65DRAFT_488665 [Rhexocercosporidium sp. MPI-PUGE-AT-0058]|nr:hypothetical protein BKA65DRAFT_488665 [Rhexocercosporidium sp. MPI-PUGE-AT-0058]
MALHTKTTATLRKPPCSSLLLLLLLRLLLLGLLLLPDRPDPTRARCPSVCSGGWRFMFGALKRTLNWLRCTSSVARAPIGHRSPSLPHTKS